MERINSHCTARTCLSFLFLFLLQASAAVDLCTGPKDISFPENNEVGSVIATITVQPGVTLAFSTQPADNGFLIDGNLLKTNKVFDFENGDQDLRLLKIVCSGPDGGLSFYEPAVSCTNINDNEPIFAKTTYNEDLPELTRIGEKLGPFEATDLDGTRPSYTLTTPHSAFRLESPNSPYLIIESLLDYDKVKNIQLTLEAKDAPLVSGDPVFTATATISITIKDVDNRPPWFEPCTPQEIDGALVCQSPDYTGRVVLNEKEDGALPLKPGPVYAFDGDSGIKAEIKYSFLGGDSGGLFAISETTGNISMTKPADVLGTISLTVLAAQRVNSYQFSTATVRISVQVKSLHSPVFEKDQYDAVISSVGSIAVDSTGEPLKILATDKDYNSTGGLNPYITYTITGSSGFSVVNGYLFMTEELPDSTLSLQVVATDSSNDESVSAPLSVEVKSGVTTSPAPTTTDSKTTGSTVPTSSPSMTTDSSVSTAIPTTTGDNTISTNPTSDPTMTSEGPSTDRPPTVIVPSGGFGPADMAALGATLGILLFISTIVIIVLVLKVQRGNSDWKKIYETSVFRNTLGQGSGGQKDSMQYTNDAFVNDENGDDPGSGGLSGEQLKNGAFILEDAIVKSTALPPLHQGDDESLAESENVDSDKEVKPILTKERRMDDGYKSVWFKEDIDPDAKEEVVIIPDSREDDSEEEDEEEEGSNSKEENEDDDLEPKAPRVVFNDTDLDSGLGVKLEDPAEDSESGEMLTVDL